MTAFIAAGIGLIALIVAAAGYFLYVAAQIDENQEHFDG